MSGPRTPRPRRSLQRAPDGWAVEIIDQTALPHALEIRRLETPDDAVRAIAEMQVRGAPLIGATAAYGLALAMRADPSDRSLDEATAALAAARPTAVNLRWAVDRVAARIRPVEPGRRAEVGYEAADALFAEDAGLCEAIGDHGLALIEEVASRKPSGAPVDVLTHCNAGWLATVDWGTALAPVYKAHTAGISVHVWVDETRPRNQGAGLTAWELGREGVPHTVIVDNAGGHLMQHGRVDLCIVGTDRTTANGDVANKVGTYLKALAARDNGVPFYVALPSPSIDWTLTDGLAGIPIEERDAAEVATVVGLTKDGTVERVAVTPPGSRVANPGFDVTPARLITGLITERGICAASAEGLAGLFPDRAGSE